jgi:hypothetical protein
VKGIDGYDKKKVIDFFYKVSKIQDITAFIHDNALFIYLPEKKEAFCWRLAVEA